MLFGAGALLPPYVEAGCVGTSVAAFDAKGDGHTDDTGSIQRAINAAAAARGGPVVFNVARYHTTGTFTLPRGVVFCGDTTQPTNAQHVIEVTAKDTAGNVGLLPHRVVIVNN